MEPTLRMVRMTRIKSEDDDVPTVDEESEVKDGGVLGKQEMAI